MRAVLAFHVDAIFRVGMLSKRLFQGGEILYHGRVQTVHFVSVRITLQGEHSGERGRKEESIYCPNCKHYFPAAVLCSSLSEEMFLVYVVRVFSFHLPASQ